MIRLCDFFLVLCKINTELDEDLQDLHCTSPTLEAGSYVVNVVYHNKST